MQRANQTLLAAVLLFAQCGRHTPPASPWAQAQRGVVHVQADFLSSLDTALIDPGNAGPVQHSKVMINGQTRDGIYMQAPAQARFPVFVHPGSRVSAWCAMLPKSWDGSTDGAEFRISVIASDTQDSVLLGVTSLNPMRREEDRAWFLREHDLSPWVGSTVLIELAVAPGPAGDSYRDWCIWGEPVVFSPPLALPRDTMERVSRQLESAAMSVDWCFVSTRALHATPDSSQLTSSLTLGGLTREGLYAHPPWSRSAIVTPGPRARLVTSLGMVESCWSRSDGVMFRVLAETSEQAPITLFEYMLHPRANRCDRAWVDISVDLSRFSGSPVRLTLATTAGWGNHLLCDSVVYGLPRVVSDI
ncbi:hypothetical protein JXA88_07145 [Candidatus Fermentibacteria bacterium]|nr:hypothetical protein [Candidatus Fermentibacteria bacterium]